MEDHGHPPHLPPLRIWELSSNSSLYEEAVAAPSEDTMVLMWQLWSVVAGISLGVILVAFFGILSNAKVRNSPFNQYLLFLMFPDIVYTGLCLINCLMNAAARQFYSEFMCNFQSWYAMFGVSGSAWMNALLAREIYRMLSFGQNFRRYVSPTPLIIARNSACILFLAAFVASWGVWQVSWLPHETLLLGGTACLPSYYNVETTLFFYLVFFPFLLLIPMGFVIYLVFQIWHKGMIPKEGRRKMLATFFFRLTAVYLIMWAPAMIFVSILNPYMTEWYPWAGAAWGHLQGAVSAGFILTKPDVRQATKDLFCCRCRFWDEKRRQRRRSEGRNKSNEGSSLRPDLWLTRSKLRSSISIELSSTTLWRSTRKDSNTVDVPFSDDNVQNPQRQATLTGSSDLQQEGYVQNKNDEPGGDDDHNNEMDDDDSDRLGTGFVSDDADQLEQESAV